LHRKSTEFFGGALQSVRFVTLHERMETMSLQANNTLGLYFSIPFCRSKCTYCNFSSGVYPAEAHERYIDRVIEELRAAGAYAEKMGVELPRRVDSVYLGGGTPSLLSAPLIDRLFAALREEFTVAKNAEITVECAPAQLEEASLAAFLRAGANRVSLGVQSFVDAELKHSGRLHTRATALETIERLHAWGITNLNIDLIAGLAGQTRQSWEESLDAMLAVGAPHASIYMLEVDEDSRLGRELLSGGSRYYAEVVPDDESIADFYTLAIERLAAAGLAQYEISNFARPGGESRHNLRYWTRRPYLGFGLDASSMQYAIADKPEERYVLRTSSTDDMNAFLEGSEPAETAWLSPDRQHEEAWFLGLRRNEGVKLSAIRREFGPDRMALARAAIKRLEPSGFLESDGKTVRLTAQGRLFSNDVFQEFLGGSEEAE